MGKLNPSHRTYLQKLGFDDPDLKTPLHDAILFWVQENLGRIVRELYPVTPWPAVRVAELKTLAKQELLSRIETLSRTIAKTMGESERAFSRESKETRLTKLNAELTRLQALPVDLGDPPEPAVEIGRYLVEVPLGNGAERNEMIVVLMTAKVHIRTPMELRLAGGVSRSGWTENLDDWVDLRWGVDKDEKVLGFEVKSSIPSFGELMRQVNTYRRYFRGVLVVVSPDDRFAKAMREQGVVFVKYDGEVPATPGQQSLL